MHGNVCASLRACAFVQPVYANICAACVRQHCVCVCSPLRCSRCVLLVSAVCAHSGCERARAKAAPVGTGAV